MQQQLITSLGFEGKSLSDGKYSFESLMEIYE